MAKKTISTSQSATQMVGDINDNFTELYQGAGGGSSSATKRVKVYDVMTGSGAYKQSSSTFMVRYYAANIKAGTKYYIQKSDRGTNWQQLSVKTADAEKAIVQTMLDHNTTPNVGTFDTEIAATSDAQYFRIESYASGKINIYHYEDVPIAGTSRWLGKKWLVIGDSISVEGTEAGLATEGYALPVARALGMQRENFAEGGTTTAYPVDNNLISGYDDDYDLITVLYGSNDQGYHCPVGSLNDSVYTGYDGTGNVGTSYIARLQILYEMLREKYPKSVIAFLTPLKRDDNGDGVETTNTLGLTTEAYADAMKSVADYYCIPCLDLYNSINPLDATSRTTFFMNDGDGLHPNELGHAIFIAPRVEAFLREIAPFWFNDWEEEE